MRSYTADSRKIAQISIIHTGFRVRPSWIFEAHLWLPLFGFSDGEIAFAIIGRYVR